MSYKNWIKNWHTKNEDRKPKETIRKDIMIKAVNQGIVKN